MNIYSRIYLLTVTTFLILSSCAQNQTQIHKQEPEQQQGQTPEPGRENAVAEVKVALLGDTGAGVNFGNILKMAASEKANVIMINGDLGYDETYAAWKARVQASINTNDIAVIGSLGNHDVERSNAQNYINAFLSFRSDKNALTTICTGRGSLVEGKDIAGVDEVCTFGNVSIISNGIGQVLTTKYLEDRLENKLKTIPNTQWKLVGYHYSLASMNPGIKGDQATYRFFDLIRQSGAIGAQAHTHSAMATCPIVSPFKLGSAVQCHQDFSDLNERFILPGTGVYVDSSLGGKEVRERERCANPTESNCKHMIDIISKEGYTRVDGIKKTNFNRFGALFMVFNVGGDPAKARAYYKSLDGQIIFSFNLSR